jgi:hypothetical protein
MMFLDAFTIAGSIVAVILIIATLVMTGCCRKRG